MNPSEPHMPNIDRESPSRRPAESPVMYQKWRSLLFLHWSFPPSLISRFLPEGLDLDTFDGKAYVGLVPFFMTGVRPAYLPALPWLSEFPETNVRTYVHRQGRDPGVYFLSLDAANPIAVILARALFRLPYYRARMQREIDPKSGRIRYVSTRFWPEPVPASTMIMCKPTGQARTVDLGTLEHFLIERYLLYTSHRNRLLRGQVHHPPYRVQSAEIEDLQETMLASHGLFRPDFHPLIHYVGGVDVEIFSTKSVAETSPQIALSNS